MLYFWPCALFNRNIFDSFKSVHQLEITFRNISLDSIFHRNKIVFLPKLWILLIPYPIKVAIEQNHCCPGSTPYTHTAAVRHIPTKQSSYNKAPTRSNSTLTQYIYPKYMPECDVRLNNNHSPHHCSSVFRELPQWIHVSTCLFRRSTVSNERIY